MSNLILVSFCFTCLHPYIIGSLCTTILVSILSISTCFQANTSDNSFNKDTKSSLFLATIYIPIFNSFFFFMFSAYIHHFYFFFNGFEGLLRLLNYLWEFCYVILFKLFPSIAIVFLLRFDQLFSMRWFTCLLKFRF